MGNISRRSLLKGAAAGTMGAIVAAGMSGTAAAVAEGVSGTHTSTAKGFAGEVAVTATFQDGVLVDLMVEGASETPDRGDKAGNKRTPGNFSRERFLSFGRSGGPVVPPAVRRIVTTSRNVCRPSAQLRPSNGGFFSYSELYVVVFPGR